MTAEERTTRLQIMLHPDELRLIEDWRYTKHMPSRAAAIRELLRRGLAAEGFLLAPEGKHSGAFNVGEESRSNKK